MLEVPLLGILVFGLLIGLLLISKKEGLTHFVKFGLWLIVVLSVSVASKAFLMIYTIKYATMVIYVFGIGVPVFMAGYEFAHHVFQRVTYEGRNPDIFDFDFHKYYKDIRTSDMVINSREWRLMNASHFERAKIMIHERIAYFGIGFCLTSLGALASCASILYFMATEHYIALIIMVVPFILLGIISLRLHTKYVNYMECYRRGSYREMANILGGSHDQKKKG